MQISREELIANIGDNLTYETIDSCNILSGTPGIVLFYAYKYKTSNDPNDYELLTRYLNQVVEDIYNNGSDNLSFGYGLAGIGWVLQELSDLDLLDLSNLGQLNLDDLDEAVVDSFANDIKLKNYDFFTGLVGKGIYLIKRYNATKNKELIQATFAALNSIKSNNGHSDYYIRHYTNDGTKMSEVNYGLAHGIPSIISFLLLAYSKGIQTMDLENAICTLVDFMIKNAIQKEGNIHYSYSDVFHKSHRAHLPIRHGWCYGDLGVAFPIMYAGKLLNKKEYYDFGNKLAVQTALRRNLSECQVFDASICHGSSGIAYMYDKLYAMTKNDTYGDAAEYWHEKTLQLCSHGKGIGGYLYWQGDVNNNYSYQKAGGFLEGAAGVAISILTKESGNSAQSFNWNHLMLLPD